jgi:hypothetical protein
VFAAAKAFAIAILPNPQDLAPETPAEFVAFIEREAASIDQTLGDLSPADLEAAGGLDAWRALVIRCVSELAEESP